MQRQQFNTVASACMKILNALEDVPLERGGAHARGAGRGVVDPAACAGADHAAHLLSSLARARLRRGCVLRALAGGRRRRRSRRTRSSWCCRSTARRAGASRSRARADKAQIEKLAVDSPLAQKYIAGQTGEEGHRGARPAGQHRDLRSLAVSDEELNRALGQESAVRRGLAGRGSRLTLLALLAVELAAVRLQAGRAARSCRSRPCTWLHPTTRPSAPSSSATSRAAARRGSRPAPKEAPGGAGDPQRDARDADPVADQCRAALPSTCCATGFRSACAAAAIPIGFRPATIALAARPDLRQRRDAGEGERAGVPLPGHEERRDRSSCCAGWSRYRCRPDSARPRADARRSPRPGSVGFVTPQHVPTSRSRSSSEAARRSSSYDLAYETYGTLNAARSNAVLVCHALNASHHVAGRVCRQSATTSGGGTTWWDRASRSTPTGSSSIGVNNLGGCHGSTGPASVNPATGRPWGAGFPLVTVEDWVQVQARLADRLGIERFAAVIGGSLGAMQALQWTIDYPDRIAPRAGDRRRARSCRPRTSPSTKSRARPSPPTPISTAATTTPTTSCRGAACGWRACSGTSPILSDDAMAEKFGRALRTGSIKFNFDVEFEIESYLRYQGDKFAEYFDANTYLRITKALDYFDPAADFGGDLAEALARARGVLPGGLVHLRLALLAGALARDRQGAGGQPAAGVLRGDRRPARARRVSDGRSALPRAGARLLRQDGPGS